jgi:hypothetical protein
MSEAICASSPKTIELSESATSFARLSASGRATRHFAAALRFFAKVQDLLKATSLHKVFDVHKDEDSALQSFGPLAAGAAG